MALKFISEIKLPKLNENLFVLVILRNMFNTWEESSLTFPFILIYFVTNKIKLEINKGKAFSLNGTINIIYLN